MGIFGWSLPPGCTNRMIEEAFGTEGPCDICGKLPDNCICPECPTCGEIGAPICYAEHGLIKSPEQVASFKEYEAEMERQAEEDRKLGEIYRKQEEEEEKWLHEWIK